MTFLIKNKILIIICFLFADNNKVSIDILTKFTIILLLDNVKLLFACFLWQKPLKN